MTLLVLDDVTKHYGSVPALDRVSIRVESGCRTAIVGPSGSGKTTLLRLIAGFEAPDRGLITLDGRVLANGPDSLAAYRREVGFVTQDGALFPHLTIAANIGFGLDKSEPDHRRRIADLAAIVELDQCLLARRPHELSGGQQQRVALARALARRPRLMLLDEPFSALDTGLRETMRKAVAALLEQEKVTPLLVTHDQGEALSFADQLVVLNEGKLVQAGPPIELYRHPVDARTAVFLGEAVLLAADIDEGWAECVLGRIPVDVAARSGRGMIMLRPEQIGIEDASQRSGPLARILEMEFGGGLSTVTLLVGGDKKLRLRTSSHALPPVGSQVRLDISGSAHPLPV